MLKSSTTSITS